MPSRQSSALRSLASAAPAVVGSKAATATAKKASSPVAMPRRKRSTRASRHAVRRALLVSSPASKLVVECVCLATPERLELPTCWFEASRSIQLSYGAIGAIPAKLASRATPMAVGTPDGALLDLREYCTPRSALSQRNSDRRGAAALLAVRLNGAPCAVLVVERRQVEGSAAAGAGLHACQCSRGRHANRHARRHTGTESVRRASQIVERG